MNWVTTDEILKLVFLEMYEDHYDELIEKYGIKSGDRFNAIAEAIRTEFPMWREL